MQPVPPEPVTWHALPPDEVAACLGVDPAAGLAEAEVLARRQQHGPNTLPTAGRARWWRVLGRQFADVLIGILVVGALLSVAAGEPADAGAIAAIVVLNGLLGFAQEWRAEKAMEALQQMLSPQARVLRGGRLRAVDAAELVPGDVVDLEAGDRVPADLRLVEASELGADESALTGESATVDKGTAAVAARAPLAERRSLALMGTAATRGRGRGLVVATGMATELGQVAGLTRAVERERTPLQRSLAALGRQLGVASIAVAVLVGLAGWWAGMPAMEMLLTTVALAVAIVPEGLPAVVTLTLALGTRAMLRRRALLRRLQAAEGLGAASVICTDKTGTLTCNEMTVVELRLPGRRVRVTGLGYGPQGQLQEEGEPAAVEGALRRALEVALGASNAAVEAEGEGWRAVGEPTEAALVAVASKAGLDRAHLPPRRRELPFDSQRKCMSVVVEEGGRLRSWVKGAPEVLLERAVAIRWGEQERPLDAEGRAWLLDAVAEMAGEGLRTLAVAERALPAGAPREAGEEELTLIAVLGIIDPPRAEVPEAIALAARAGIRTLMITGDAPGTALAIARRVGLPAARVLTGAALDALDDRALGALLAGPVHFARTSPAHKLRIVRALQARGEVVAMTGDGVNDAPALKQADVGIAMGLRGTEVARGAADMVLTDDNYASIVGAVEEGRRQYDNIQKFVRYLLSSNTGEVVALVASLAMGGPLLLLPVQILWMNLVTDGVSALALGAEPAEDRVMQRPPRDPRQRILHRGAVLHVLALGTWMGGACLALFLSRGDPALDLDHARTVAFTGLVVIEKLNALSFRSLRSPWSALGLGGNPWLLLAVAGTLLLQVAVVYLPPLQALLRTVPLSPGDWLLILGFALPVFLVPELWKLAQRAREGATAG